MIDTDFIYTPRDALDWALKSGWTPSTLPIGVVSTFHGPLAGALREDTDRFRDETQLTVGNGRMLMTNDDVAPVLVARLNPGAAAMTTQLEHLRYLGSDTKFAALVGAAGALAEGFQIADVAVVDSALRTDGISDSYLPRADSVDADRAFVDALQASLATTHDPVRTWTVPVPFRSTRYSLQSALASGASVVEMEIASLYAAAIALGVKAAATIVISDVNRVENWHVDWSDTTSRLVEAVHATIAAIPKAFGDDHRPGLIPSWAEAVGCRLGVTSCRERRRARSSSHHGPLPGSLCHLAAR